MSTKGMRFMECAKLNKRTDLSLLRIVATLSVIFIHTCNTLANNAGAFSLCSKQHIFLNTAFTMVHWAVPLFFMITGSLLLNKSKSISTQICLSKYVKRIVLALFIFGVPFSWLEIIATSKTISISTFVSGFVNVVTGNSWGHLWYLYALIGIYLILPVIKSFTDNCARKELRNVILILAVFNLCVPIIEKSWGGEKIGFCIPISSYSVLYLLIGKYLDDELPSTLTRHVCELLLLSCMIGIVWMNIIFYPDAIDYLDYSSPIVAVMSIAIFSLIKGIEIPPKYHQTIWQLDRLCFGAYLVHPLFTNLIYKFLRLTPMMAGKFYPIAVFGFWVAFSVFGFVSSKVLSCIKPLKKYVL